MEKGLLGIGADRAIDIVDPAMGTSLEGTTSTGVPVEPIRMLVAETEAAETPFCLDAEGTIWVASSGGPGGQWQVDSTLKDRLAERNQFPE